MTVLTILLVSNFCLALFVADNILHNFQSKLVVGAVGAVYLRIKCFFSD